MSKIPLSKVVLKCQRLALRPTKDAPLQWYGESVRFMLLDGLNNWSASMKALEVICEAAAAEYGLEYLKHHAIIVEAPTEEALALMDVSTLNTVEQMQPPMLTKETAVESMQETLAVAETVYEVDAYRVVLTVLKRAKTLEAAIATLYRIAGRYAMYAELVPMPSIAHRGYESTVERCLHLGVAIRRIAFSFEYALTGKDIEAHSVEERLEDCTAFDVACLNGKWKVADEESDIDPD